MRHLAKLFFYSLVTVGLVGCGPEAATTSKSTATKSSPTETDSQSSDQGESTSSQPMAEKPVEETVAVAATGDGEGGNLSGRITLKGDILRQENCRLPKTQRLVAGLKRSSTSKAPMAV